MIALRWEVIPLFQPWAQPQAGLLTAPIASGTIAREDWDPVAKTYAVDPAVYANSDPIILPAGDENARFHVLALEVYGARGWTVTIGSPEHPPVGSDTVTRPVDLVANIQIPGSGIGGFAYRSREMRAVRPGALFIARPWPGGA